MKILRTLLLYGPNSLGLSVIYIKAEGFSGKMLKLRLHATRPSFYREARGGGQTGVGFNQPDEEAPINVVSLQLDCFQAGQELFWVKFLVSLRLIHDRQKRKGHHDCTFLSIMELYGQIISAPYVFY